MTPTTRRAVDSRAALVLVSMTWVSITLATPALADQVIGRGREPQVLALFAPSGMGDEVVPGYRLRAVAIRPREIELSLEEAIPSGPSAATVLVRLVARDSPLDEGMVAIAESASFALIADREVADARRASLLQLAARVRENDRGRFWTEVATVQAEQDAPEAAGLILLVQYVVGAALIAAVLLAALKRRRASKDVQ